MQIRILDPRRKQMFRNIFLRFTDFLTKEYISNIFHQFKGKNYLPGEGKGYTEQWTSKGKFFVYFDALYTTFYLISPEKRKEK